MPTRPYSEFATKKRATWSADAQDLAQRLSAQLDSERSAQEALGRQITSTRQQADISRIERGLGNPTRDTLLKLVEALDMQIVLLPKEAQLK